MGYKIYTAGKMGGLSVEEQMAWRREFERCLLNEVKLSTTKGDNCITFIHPPMYYGYGTNDEQSFEEMMRWEFNQIKTCDVMVVNLALVESSIGTLMELGAAQAMNYYSGRFLPVLGIGEPSEYPWVNAVLWRREKTIEEAVKTICRYILI